VPQARPERSVGLSRLDVLVVPGIGFDEMGRRIGFGKGYYDRVLETFSGMAIGLAYEFQILKEIPCDPLDRPCHWVVTEKRVIQGAQGRKGKEVE